jgi:hypothetical protein
VHRVRKTNQVANSPIKVPAAKIQNPMLRPHSTPIRIPMTSCPTNGGKEMIICVQKRSVTSGSRIIDKRLTRIAIGMS